MAVLLDVSAIVAAADTADLNHAAARAWFERVDEPLLLGALTLGEADHVLQRELGQPATLALIEALTSGAIRVVAPTDADLVRAAALLVEHAEHRPRLSDALLVAAATRLGVRRVATFDRRPLAVLAPRGPRRERPQERPACRVAAWRAHRDRSRTYEPRRRWACSAASSRAWCRSPSRASAPDSVGSQNRRPATPGGRYSCPAAASVSSWGFR